MFYVSEEAKRQSKWIRNCEHATSAQMQSVSQIRSDCNITNLHMQWNYKIKAHPKRHFRLKKFSIISSYTFVRINFHTSFHRPSMFLWRWLILGHIHAALCVQPAGTEQLPGAAPRSSPQLSSTQLRPQPPLWLLPGPGCPSSSCDLVSRLSLGCDAEMAPGAQRSGSTQMTGWGGSRLLENECTGFHIPPLLAFRENALFQGTFCHPLCMKYGYTTSYILLPSNTNRWATWEGAKNSCILQKVPKLHVHAHRF